MNAHAQSPVPLEASVGTVLDVLAWEIELAGARCIFLDTVIGRTMQALPKEQQDVLVEGLHAVDLLSQHLTSLSAFARRMSADTPAGTVAPVSGALADITLGALADRMVTAFGGEETDTGADAGEVDLF